MQSLDPGIATKTSAYIGLEQAAPETIFKLQMICQSVEDYARAFFLFFRECDEAGVEVIFCQAVEETDLGLALMDRLRRAAYDNAST